jgi:hypothetical protein
VLDGAACLGVPFGAPVGGGGASPRALGGPTSELSSICSRSFSSTYLSLSRGSTSADRLTPSEADIPDELRGISLGPVVGRCGRRRSARCSQPPATHTRQRRAPRPLGVLTESYPLGVKTAGPGVS